MAKPDLVPLLNRVANALERLAPPAAPVMSSSSSVAAIGLGWLHHGNPMAGRMMLVLAPMPLLIGPTVWCDGLLVRRQKLPSVHVILFLAELASLIVLAVLLNLLLPNEPAAD